MDNNIPTVEPVVAPIVAEPVVAQAPVVSAPVATLPDDTKDRTSREFEKLIQNNQRMAAEIARLEAVKAAPTINPTAPQVTPDDFTYEDSATGEKFIDGKKLKDKLDDVNAKAQRAEEIINKYVETERQKEIARQESEAFASYPELNPNGEKYDPNFEKLVGGILQDSMWNPAGYGGKALSFKAAGDFVRGQITPPTVAQPVQVDAAQQAATEAAQAAREQVTAQPATQPGPQTRANADDDEVLQNLRYRTRYLNDDAALAERIKHTEHILTKDANLT